MKLTELRAKLNELQLPTTGVKEELIERYQVALRLERNKRMFWDALSMSWLPIPDTVEPPSAMA